VNYRSKAHFTIFIRNSKRYARGNGQEIRRLVFCEVSFLGPIIIIN